MLFTHHVIPFVLGLIVPATAGEGMVRREKFSKSGLRKALEEVLSGDRAQRLFVVEGTLRPTFEAFPKNSAGKIAMQSLHSMAREYFASEHGWLFRGFEFAGSRSTKLQESRLLQTKIPKLAAALEEADLQADGISLSDAVLSVAALEHLVLEESKGLLHRAYELNKAPFTGAVRRAELEEILASYLMLFRKGTSYNSDPSQHSVQKQSFMKSMEDEGLVTFYRESVDAYTEHTEEGYALRDTEQIVQDVALRYGQWQNGECEVMKQALVKLDSDRSGRVSFDVFHSQPHSRHFSFTEPIDYLRNMNSLDETKADEPKVMIANYLASQSNCIAWSDYFSVCCLNECESLLNELEGRVQTTDVPVEKLITTVAEIPSGTVTVPRELPPRLVELARQVAGAHGGVVPILTGDFRRWFHFAFPNECPYPTDLEAEVAEGERDAAERWLGRSLDGSADYVPPTLEPPPAKEF